MFEAVDEIFEPAGAFGTKKESASGTERGALMTGFDSEVDTKGMLGYSSCKRVV